MISSLVINEFVLPFFFLPTVTTILMCFIMKITSRQVVYSSAR